MAVTYVIAVGGTIQLASAVSGTRHRRAYRILKKGGRLVVIDLFSHRFEKARELYADHWLGFSEVQLHQWLEEAVFPTSK